jgi:hypothetical protein
MRRSWWVGLVAGFGLVVGLLGAAAAGWLGPLEICGADQAALCVAWPGIASAALWLTFVATVGGLFAWQIWTWRGAASVDRRELLAFAAIFAVALVERVWRPDLALLGYDESAAASLVGAWRTEGLFPLTGIVSSIGVPNPPGWPYLLALVLLANDSPYALVGLGIVTSLLALTLIWWVGRRWLGTWGALAAAAFYATGFWAIFLGRSGWQPVFLQVPVILCLDTLLVLATRRWPWALTIACGWLALMIQLHYIGAVFAVLLPIAAWPARRALRPVHLASGVLLALVLLLPFLLYEAHPSVRGHDLTRMAGDATIGARLDLASWNLLWTLAGNGGAVGLAGADPDTLRAALGRWASLGLLGIPLVAAGLLVAAFGWPRGWRGWLLVAWVLTPVVGLARHTLDVLFHYLYLGLPGMALAVGVLAAWTAFPGRTAARWVLGVALAIYAVVSAATLVVVLQHVDRTGAFPSQARPLGLNLAAATATNAVRPPGAQVLIGGEGWQVEVLRFGLGFGTPARIFDECDVAAIPRTVDGVYLLNDEASPAARALAAAGAPLLTRVPRPDGAFTVYGAPQTDLSGIVIGPCGTGG